MSDYPTDTSEFSSAAACIVWFESEGGGLNPDVFKPLAPLTGEINMIRIGEKPFSMVMAANAYVNHSLRVGATCESAIESIALNGDQHPGLVALALEMAALCTRERKTPKELLLTIDQYCDLVDRLYIGNVGGIFTLMNGVWKVDRHPEMPAVVVSKTRTQWREELGHDVLLHPKDLQPLQVKAGPLEFKGTRAWEGGAEMAFGMPGGELMVTQGLPEQWTET